MFRGWLCWAASNHPALAVPSLPAGSPPAGLCVVCVGVGSILLCRNCADYLRAWLRLQACACALDSLLALFMTATQPVAVMVALVAGHLEHNLFLSSPPPPKVGVLGREPRI